IPAATAVGPSGCVLAIDAARDLLSLVPRKARAEGLGNIHIAAGDLLDVCVVDAAFDAVVCVFGIFFVPDMRRAVRELWRCVRPGGHLAITTWGPRLFEPVSTVFWHAVRRERPDLYKAFNPWDILVHPEPLLALMEESGVPAAQVAAEAGAHPLPTPAAWWALVMGSGYRGTVDQLAPDARERVRTHSEDYIASAHVTAVETNVLYATAVKG
ncbi:MAG TPA: class I SAM-dependent methyltransferase, partial [Vicinamibacterales bacterium]|nr:class I SAM-dependent methyltransferase [Vicinamibacterales bacterium]